MSRYTADRLAYFLASRGATVRHYAMPAYVGTPRWIEGSVPSLVTLCATNGDRRIAAYFSGSEDHTAGTPDAEIIAGARFIFGTVDSNQRIERVSDSAQIIHDDHHRTIKALVDALHLPALQTAEA
jgi:hypothetical protein